MSYGVILAVVGICLALCSMLLSIAVIVHMRYKKKQQERASATRQLSGLMAQMLQNTVSALECGEEPEDIATAIHDLAGNMSFMEDALERLCYILHNRENFDGLRRTLTVVKLNQARLRLPQDDKQLSDWFRVCSQG